MVSTWIGGGNNKASDPGHWSPQGVPTDEDAVLTHGTMVIDGDELAPNRGASLEVRGGDVTIKMSHPGHSVIHVRPIDVESGFLAIDARDTSQFNLFEASGASTLVDILPSTTQWRGGFQVGGDLTIAGTGTFVPTQPTAVGSGGHVSLNVNVAKGDDIFISGASMEVGKVGVAAGEVIELAGSSKNPLAFLKLDLPEGFNGTLALGPNSQVDLAGLVARDGVASYSLKNDLLSFYNNHNVVVDTVALQQSGFILHPVVPAVATVGGDVFIYNDVVPSGSTLLPQHG